MPIARFNPPLTNSSISEFFEFESDQKNNLNLLRNQIKQRYPMIEEGLKYHIPFYSINKKSLFFLHYIKLNGNGCFSSEISFIKGGKMFDNLNLFQEKNTSIKSILIPNNLSNDFIENIFEHYIDQSISLI